MTNHYVYEPEFCNPAAGWERGQVEKNVRDSRHQMLQCMPDFPDLAALNAWLEQRCLELWRQTPAWQTARLHRRCLGRRAGRADAAALVLHHDEQAVLTAVELALAEGVPTKTHVLNLLHRLIDGKVIGAPPLDTPLALVLHREPMADVERYDGLRSQIAGGHHAS